MSLTSETPQVATQTDLISLLRSTEVDRAVQAAIEPRKRPKLDRAGAVTVPGTVYTPLSRRGLLNKIVLVRVCPHCGEAHQFRDSGLRIASCGLGYLRIKGRRARRPRKAA